MSIYADSFLTDEYRMEVYPFPTSSTIASTTSCHAAIATLTAVRR